MEILQKEQKVEYQISGRQAVYKSNPGTATVCRKRGAAEQEKVQHIKSLHDQESFILSHLIVEVR